MLPVRQRSGISWGFWLIAIILAGILSRIVHTGFVLIDKYLGDGLYAAMVYALLRLTGTSRAATAAISASIVMTAIETFQLTLIPAHMLTASHLLLRILARLLGTQFSYLDLLAYYIAIACLYVIDSPRTDHP